MASNMARCGKKDRTDRSRARYRRLLFPTFPGRSFKVHIHGSVVSHPMPFKNARSNCALWATMASSPRPPAVSVSSRARIAVSEIPYVSSHACSIFVMSLIVSEKFTRSSAPFGSRRRFTYSPPARTRRFCSMSKSAHPTSMTLSVPGSRPVVSQSKLKNECISSPLVGLRGRTSCVRLLPQHPVVTQDVPHDPLHERRDPTRAARLDVAERNVVHGELIGVVEGPDLHPLGARHEERAVVHGHGDVDLHDFLRGRQNASRTSARAWTHEVPVLDSQTKYT